ncbi:hypothetical protein ABZ780_13240 [Micromonospora sp. NPDC047467]|uniref:hypothetical protein n=1 Tax=Micromonospora sp. NPDC047467 TaxID=3154814 RepID=UPI0033CBC0B9
MTIANKSAQVYPAALAVRKQLKIQRQRLLEDVLANGLEVKIGKSCNIESIQR